MKPWPIFEVGVYGFDPFLYTAPTRSKARWRAYEAFRNYRESETFVEFLERGVSLRRLAEPPADDGYDYVRSAYGVSPKIGEIYELVREGPSSGRRVICVYPGRHTSMVHCAYEGQDRPMIVHPMNIQRLPEVR